MTPILDAPADERMKRALLAIEALAGESPDAGSLMGRIYMIAHAAVGKCKAPHANWLLLIEECEHHGKKANIYDVDEVFAVLGKEETQ